MNMLKRSLAMLLVLTLLFSFVPFSVFADDGESVETTAVTEAVEQRSGGPGNSDFGHSQGNGKDEHKDPLKETEAPEVTEAPTETTVPETTVPETTVPETTVPETTVPETTVPETTVPETTQETVPETTQETVPAEGLYALNTLDLEAEIATVADVDVQYRVLHLDNGRKYFSAAWIKALINEMAAAGYNQLQLAFGNDGLRFLLNDMSVTVNGTTYSSEAVTAGIQAGNNAYNASVNYAPSVNALTQAEMDDIIAHANSKGVAIVPHMNMPGHMDAILDAIEYVGISNAHFTGSTTSVRSLNLNNADAVAFAKALLQKYVDYFASKGCGFFHIGADEFANDAYGGSMGFPSMGASLYTKFAAFVNDCAAIVKGKGMTPRAWNDGISYGEGNAYSTTNYSETFDTGIQVTYWSSGWGSGYAVAPASTLHSKGHQMINTNGDYYFILNSNGITNPSGTALNFNNTSFMGSTIADPIGSMFCIWCDSPGIATEQETAAAARITLRKMAAAMKNSTSYSEKVVPGGFNADGTIHVVEPEQPEETEPTTPVEPAPVVDDVTKVGVTAAEVKSIKVTAVTENVPAVEGASAVIAFDVTPETEDGAAYTGEATVSIPVSAEWTNVRGGVLASAHGGEVIGLEGELKTDAQGNKTFTFTAPHFSTVFAYEVAPVDEGDLADTVVAGSGTAATFVLDKNGLDINAQYLIVSGNNALKNDKTSLTVTVSGDNATPSNDAAAALWTYTATEYNGNHYNSKLSNGSNFLYTSVTGNWYDRQYNLVIDGTSNNPLTITSNNDGTYKVYRRSSSIDAYIVFDNGWGAAAESQALSFYKYTPGTQTFTVNAALQESRITALTVANDSYTDESWNAYQTALTAANNKLTEIRGKTYNSETAANTALNELKALVDALEIAKNALAKSVEITIIYQTADGAVIKSETRRVSEKDTSITLSNFNHNDKFYVVNSATQSITPATVTEYTVTVTETAEDLSQVADLNIEYWITNARTTGTTTNRNYLTIKANDTGIHSAAGVATVTLVDAEASAGSRTQSYWQTKMLDVEKANSSTSGHEYQTLYTGDDETLNGAAFTHVRYWEGAWQVKTASGWVPVDRTIVEVDEYDVSQKTGTVEREKNQLVAYYMEIVDIKNANGTTELVVNTADWGKKGDGTAANDYLDPSSTVSVSVQIIYEDGSGNPANADSGADAGYPADSQLLSKTVVYGYWTAGRGLGTMVFTGGEQFEIYRVTAETGSHTVAAGDTWSGITLGSFEWDNNAKTVWEGTPTESVSIGNPARGFRQDSPYDNLMWDENHEAILIRVYVKAVKTEDSLNVVYIDEKFNDTLYSYNIQVPAEKNFTDDMIGTPDTMGNSRINVTGCGIENVYGQTQYFQTDLTKVPEAKGKYNSELYTYTGSEISEDGKTLYLYYNINTTVLKPNFVVDFGLPITFNLSDVTETPALAETVTASARYGTVDYNDETKVFTYKPTKILQNIDVISVNILFDGAQTTSTTNVGVTPATTVYYEESFLLSNDQTGWTHTSATIGNQQTAVLGARKDNDSINNYGYDGIYADKGTNTGYITGGTGAYTSFTFTGTGFQLYGNSNNSSGYVTVMSNGGVNKMYMINTELSAGTSDATNQQLGATYCNLPFISETALPFGTYTVQIKQTNGENPIYLDGVRILNTINDKTEGEGNIYYNDKEDNPEFYELRDAVLNVLCLNDENVYDESIYNIKKKHSDEILIAVKDMAGQVYNKTNGAVAMITDESVTYGEKYAQDLLDNGPKNELYLYNGQTLTFKVDTDRIVQIGLKAPTGSASFTLNNTAKTLNTSVDMFYEMGTASDGKTFEIKNTGDNVLSVTLLKICDDPNAAFLPLTQTDIENVLMNIVNTSDEEETPVNPSEPVKPETPTEPSKPVEPTEPEKPTEPEVEETKPTKPGKPEKPAKPGQNKPGKPAEKQKDAKLKITYVNLMGKKVGSATLTETGAANQRCTFSVSEIFANAPAGRNALWFLPVVVPYGGNVSIVVPVI